MPLPRDTEAFGAVNDPGNRLTGVPSISRIGAETQIAAPVVVRVYVHSAASVHVKLKVNKGVVSNGDWISYV